MIICHRGIEPRSIVICQKKSPRKSDVLDTIKPYSTIVSVFQVRVVDFRPAP